MSKPQPLVTMPRRCRSKRHAPGQPCGNPRCPEGAYKQQLWDEILTTGNLDKLFDAASRDNLVIKRVSTVEDIGGARDGFNHLTLGIPGKDKGNREIRVSPNRKHYAKLAQRVKKDQIPSFESTWDLAQYAMKLYDGGVVLNLHMNRSPAQANGQPRWSAIETAWISVDADMRGHGVSTHLKRMLIKHAEEHNQLLTENPSGQGDGSTPIGSKALNWQEGAAQHERRLRRSLYRNGYVPNPLHGETGSNNHGFTAEAADFLRQQDQFIRFPEDGELLHDMLEPGASFTMRAPELADNAQATKPSNYRS